MKKKLLTLDVILSKEIKYMLEEKHYLPDDKLPSERELAEYFQVQRLTIRSALNLLLQDKTIYSKPRSGYYMAPKRMLQSIQNFSLDSSPTNNKNLQSKLMDFKKINADFHLAGKMLLPEGTAIFKIILLYYDEEKPVCISNLYIPEYIFPNLTADAIASSPSIDKIINNCQINISKSNQKIVLVYANEYETTILKVASGSPLMKYKGLMYDKQGHLAIFFENIMLIDYFGFYQEAKK